ncbi:MAG: hypothetical protein U9N45_04125, partial [Gemmatimonadota bacterium]|nr:hypothetical protein [Gemmatimonadota bacterium]
SRAKKQLRNSLGTINAGLITLLQDSRDMKNSESGIGMDQMLSQLEALAEQQENLNRMTQGAFSKFSQQSPDGNPMSNPMGAPGHLNSPGDLMRLMRQLAAEQQAIREQVAELARQMSGRKNMPGSILEGVMKDADQVVRDMIEKGVSPETFKRQRKILDRLLDSQRSMQKRDSGRRRKSERPGEYFVTPPEDLATELLERSEEENLLKDMLEHWKGAYPESFETLIRDYFELLRAKEIGH